MKKIHARQLTIKNIHATASKNSYKEFDNKTKFLPLKNPPPPVTFLMVRPLHWTGYSHSKTPKFNKNYISLWTGLWSSRELGRGKSFPFPFLATFFPKQRACSQARTIKTTRQSPFPVGRFARCPSATMSEEKRLPFAGWLLLPSQTETYSTG